MKVFALGMLYMSKSCYYTTNDDKVSMSLNMVSMKDVHIGL
jgi:hypothetical protein